MTEHVPFDAIAGNYDREFSETRIGRLQRERVWHFLAPFLAGRSHVLELSGGTGEDALRFARLGHPICYTDVSAAMLSVGQAKIAAQAMQDKIQVCRLDMRKLGDFQSELQPFDLLFSNFGGLNCLSPDELRQCPIQEQLRPGGLFVAVIMGRACIWERLYFLAKGKIREAFRRRSRSALAARLDADNMVDTWYYSPSEFSAFFPDFEQIALHPVGLFLPPSYLEPFFRGKTKFLRLLLFLEKRFSGKLWANYADHYIIVLKRR